MPYTSESILLRDYFVPNFVEMAPIVLDLFEKALMTCIFTIFYYLPLGKGVTIHLNNWPSPKNATCVAEIRQCIFTSFRFPLVENAWSLLYPINWCFVLRRFGWNSPGPKYNLKIAKCIFTIIYPRNRTGFHHGRFARGRRNVIYVMTTDNG